MKRKVLSVLLCAGLAVSMLAGCGSDSSNANKKAESTGSCLKTNFETAPCYRSYFFRIRVLTDSTS